MQSIGLKIRKLRELQDLTQENMAKALGVSQPLYSKIERGEVDITYSNLKKIAQLLNVNEAQLLSFDGNMMIQKINEHQNGGQAGFVINHGIIDKERQLYESKIALLQDEVDFLRSLIKEQKNI
jgi:transcriptional regulator with XRE-family HTH domain